jgi:hypothetical protein
MIEKRNFLRAQVMKSTCIAKDQGTYKLVTESTVPIPVNINVLDISTGGLRLITEVEILNGTNFDLMIQEIKALSGTTVKCKVTRSLFDKSDSIYEIGVRFIPANTDYLKQLVELLKKY